MKGEAGGAFVACVTGRGRGSDGETQGEEGPQTAVCQGTEECLSYFMRKKTNKQTKRSKAKGKKGNHGAFSKEPNTANSAGWRVGKFSFVLRKEQEAYVDPGKKKNKNHPLNNQMPLDWLQKALSGGVHSARWLPAEMRAAPKMTAILQKSSSWHGAGALAIRD